MAFITTHSPLTGRSGIGHHFKYSYSPNRHTNDVARNMIPYGGFIPGVRTPARRVRAEERTADAAAGGVRKASRARKRVPVVKASHTPSVGASVAVETPRVWEGSGEQMRCAAHDRVRAGCVMSVEHVMCWISASLGSPLSNKA